MGTLRYVSSLVAGTGGGGGGPETLTVKVTVANQAARFALTIADVQNGDLVEQTDTGALYEVIDDESLDEAAGYQQLATGSAASLTSGTLDAARLPSGISPTLLSTTVSDVLLGRTSSGGGAVQEVPCSDDAQALLAAADYAAMRTALGAPNISGTPVAGQVAVWSDADTLQALAANTAVIIGTDPGGSDLLRVGGGVTHSGAVTMSGSPASAGASVRNRHGNGGTTDIVDNVPTGGAHKRTINGVEYESLNADGTVTLHATTAASLAAALGAGAPTGTVAMWGTGSAPTGWLLADGSAVSRTTYSALFAIIGTTFGAGDGSTTFALPDFRGRAPIGAGTGSGLTARTLAGTVGTETHTLTAAESGLPAHTHGLTGWATNQGTNGVPAFTTAVSSTTLQTDSVAPASASQSHPNMQPSLVVNFIIKT